MPNPAFLFQSADVSDSYFTVVAFTGHEAMSKLFHFEIELKGTPGSTRADDFLDTVLSAEADFIMEYDGTRYTIHGMLARFDELQTAGGATYFRAVLVPRLWQLTLTRNCLVYTDTDTDANATGMTVLEILSGILDGYQLDYEIGDVTGALRSKTYRCQFNESDFDFISRLLESEGIFYYFEYDQVLAKEKIIFSDGAAGDGFATGSSVVYDANPPANRVYESVNAWMCRKQRMPGKIKLESYDYRNPSDDVLGEYDVRISNLEEQYSYGHNMNIDEADRLAEIHAEASMVMATQYLGESGVCGFHAGRSFDLNGHPNAQFNDIAAYVITEIRHEGQSLDVQITSGGSGIQSQIHGQHTARPQYRNSFTVIDSDIQFRPQRTIRKPRFYGTITAFVYSANAADTAYINEYGEYRVTLPFRRFSDTDSERATHWVRMAQPYHGNINGVPEGMFYPLMADTEVLLTFINGDPDRPIISAALPNGAAPSLVKTDSNQDNSHQTVFSTHGMYKQDIRGGLTSIAGVKSTGDRGTDRDDSNEDMTEFTVLNEADGSSTGQTLDEESGEFLVTRRYGIEYSFVDSTVFSYGGNRVRSFNFGCNYEENHEKVASDNSVVSTETYPLNERMQALGTHQGVDYSGWSEANNGFVSKTWSDTCEYQFGNSYNWGEGNGPGGAPCAYNYGNSYTENLLEKDRGSSADITDALMQDTYTGYVQIDTSKASIEKTFGATYSYQKGFSLDVKEGDASEIVAGNSDSKVTGATSSIFGGASNDMFLGVKNEMALTAANSMTVGLTNDLFIGGKIDTTLAAILEMSAGAKIEINGVAEMEVKNVAGKIKLCEMDTTTTASLKTVTTQIKTNATNIKTAATQLKTSATDIATTAAVKMLNSALTMIN